MMRRNQDTGGPRRPETPWLAGAMIGLTVATLATGAIILGASLALGQAITRGK